LLGRGNLRAIAEMLEEKGGRKHRINKVSGNVTIISDTLLFWQKKPFHTEPSLSRAKTPQFV